MLHQEVEYLILRNTEVRVRADRGVQREDDRVTFRIAPGLALSERYNYLLSRLVPRPRKEPHNGPARKETVKVDSRPVTILRHEDKIPKTTTSTSPL